MSECAIAGMNEVERPNIVEVYEYYGLRVVGTRGEWRKAECPLPEHEDVNPSASINEELGKFKCWVCNKRGDSLDIIRERETLARFSDALRFAKEHFAAGSREVRDERVRGGGLLAGAGNRRAGGAFVPAWRRI